MSEGRIATTAAMLALFAGMSLIALGFPPKARFAPLLIGVPGALLCLAQLALDLRARIQGPRGRAAEAEEGADEGMSRREWFMFAWLGVFTAAIIGFGFQIGGSLVVFLYIRFGERESWVNAIAAGIGTFVLQWLVFTELLELSLFEGLVLERLM